MKIFSLDGIRPKTKSDITIVSGLPRSGTSMMMKMLEAGGLAPISDNIRAADSDNPKGYYEFERVKKLQNGDHAWLEAAMGKVVKIISYLVTELPPNYDYRILFMHRDMQEVLASQKKMLRNRRENTERISDAEMAQLYAKHLAEVTGWIGRQPNIASLSLHYNKLIKNPELGARAINVFLGGHLDEQKMSAVIDRRLYRQRAVEGWARQ